MSDPKPLHLKTCDIAGAAAAVVVNGVPLQVSEYQIEGWRSPEIPVKVTLTFTAAIEAEPEPEPLPEATAQVTVNVHVANSVLAEQDLRRVVDEQIVQHIKNTSGYYSRAFQR